MKVLVLNAGSSSLKYALFAMQDEKSLIQGMVERIGDRESVHQYKTDGDYIKVNHVPVNTHKQGLKAIFQLLSELSLLSSVDELHCIGHRVVHGGENFSLPTLIDTAALVDIKKMEPLAPLHNPANITGIEVAMEYAADIVQVAVFDTAFHQTMPEYAFHYAVPRAWYEEKGVRRYGFHGTSHFYVAKQAAKYLDKPLHNLNLITLHLGNGASMTAISAGKSIDTTMGMTPLEGVMMGTRCGDLDPAIILYLNRQGLSCAEIDIALNKQSGLKGVCSENDMRAVHKMADSGDELARLALVMYSYRIKKYIGAYTAVLGRVDALVFTGGVGEHDAWLRSSCCEQLDILGIGIDQHKNNQVQGEISEISQSANNVRVLVIATNEELEIAQQASACVQKQNSV